MPFQVFIGGRGTGKTFSALTDGITKDYRFMYLRRTETEVKMLTSEATNPMKAINRVNGTNVLVEPMRDMAVFNQVNYDEDGNISEKIYKACMCPLTTFSKIRGVDFSDLEVITFDEFIPEKHVRYSKFEGEAFLHLYETVNRNRELEGKPPVRVYFLANAIALNNPILLTLGIVTKIARMKAEGQKRYSDKKRGIYVELIDSPEFTVLKSQTALYQLAGGTNFSEEALNNNFSHDDMRQIKKVPLNEFKPLFCIANSYVMYAHKSNGTFHCAKVKNAPRGIENYHECDKDVIYWRYAPQYRLAILRRLITFSDYTTKIMFDFYMSR